MDVLVSIPFLIFLPMLASFLVMSPLFTNNEILIRRFTKSVCGFQLLYTIFLLAMFSPSNPFTDKISFWGTDWIQALGVQFVFKIDGVGMVLVLLTSFIFFIASIASKMNIRRNHKFYYSMLLLLMSAVYGIFTASDMFVFFMFWELELIPAYFLIGGDFSLEENTESKKSAVKFVLFTFLGSMILLLGILLLHYYNYATTQTFTALFDDILINGIPLSIKLLISICFLIGFGVKLPIIPLHTWLPDAHTNAPVPVSMILAGVMLKTGAYGILRFNYQIMQDVFQFIAPILAIFALINIIYTAFVAYSQTDIKRIVAYSSISNMGLILLGLCAYNKIGFNASVFHMFAHGLVTAGLFMICGIVYMRCKTRDINSLGGIAVKMPRLLGFATLIVLASVGIPAFAPFISEILTIISAMFSDLGIVLKIVSILSLPLLIISSCYMLKFLHKGFMGNEQEKFAKINDITVHEFVVLGSITAGLLIFGILPNVLIGIIG
ncbi:MAG: NADH-quinone oxidoreductase subunit M [bacterium]|nr:NADH-quinone oxidoreductase subunit M [bacterium]